MPGIPISRATRTMRGRSLLYSLGLEVATAPQQIPEKIQKQFAAAAHQSSFSRAPTVDRNVLRQPPTNSATLQDGEIVQSRTPEEDDSR